MSTLQEAPPPAAADVDQPPTARTERPPRRSVARTILPGLLLTGVFLALARLGSFPLGNPDTYFHLRFGHEFLSGNWSLRDPGSVSTFATADWVPTQWLPQVVMAQAEDWFGLPGVAWLSGLQFLTLGLTLFWACRRQAEPLVAVLLTFLALVACTPGMSMRPQQISYVLVAFTTSAWLSTRKTGRVPWVLVPLTWVWTMCHGMWPVGIVIGFAAVAGLALDRAHPPRKLAQLLAVPVASALVSLVTPVGPGLFPAVLLVKSRAKYFYEWGPPQFTHFYAVVLLLLLALSLLPRLRRGERVPWFDLALIALAALWAVYSIRTIPVAACMAAPLAALALQPALGPLPRAGRREKTLVFAGYVGALAVLAVMVPQTASQPHATPSWMDSSLGDLPAGTKVLDESSTGGFLMWKYPQLDLVAHGYGDTYTDAELERNADIDGVRTGWVELVKNTDVSYAVLDPGSPLAYNLREVEGWTVVHAGKDLEMLAPPPGWMDE